MTGDASVVDLRVARHLKETQLHPDPALRELVITWSQRLNNTTPDDAEVRRLISLAQGIIATPATTLSGVNYKLAAAIAFLVTRYDENDLAKLIVHSAAIDLDNLGEGGTR